MFPKRHVKLDLPFLKKVNEVKVNHPEKSFKGSLFKLDWNYIDSNKFSNFKSFLNDWNINDYTEVRRRYPGVTSSKNLKFTDGMRFLIKDDYLNQIRYHIFQAYDNLVNIRLSDTMIRDYCAKASHTNVQIAFFLLADCLFDEKKSYFDRNYNLRMITSSLLWRYWSFNTGRGLLLDKCLIYDLKQSLDYNFIDDKTQIENHIDDFYKWYNNLEKAYDFISMTEENNEGESKD